RRKRRDALERLIPMLAGTLDVRSVFEQIAQVALEVVPSDFIGLALLTEDGKAERVQAKWGLEGDVERLPDFPLPAEVQHTVQWDYLPAQDIAVLGDNRVRMHVLNLDPLPPSDVEMRLDDFWIRLYSEMGVRSLMRANVRRNGVAIGGLLFLSRQPAQFDDE